MFVNCQCCRLLTAVALVLCVGLQAECSRVCDDDVEESLHVAYKKIPERENLELKLAAKGRVISRNQKTADSSQNRDPLKDLTVRRKRTVQLPFEFATERLYNRFSLTKDEMSYDLPKKQLSGNLGRRATEDCQQETQSSIRCDPRYPYRTADATCNNLNNPRWGSTFACFQRLLEPSYVGAFGFRQSVRGGGLPLPRSLSLNVHSHLNNPTDYVNQLYMFFGQLLDHDITFTPFSTTTNNSAIQCCPLNEESHPQCAAIEIGARDPFYSRFGVRCLNFVRSETCPDCTLGYRNQFNIVTAPIDASFLYSNLANETALLRTFNNGLMRSQYSSRAGELLPPTADPNNDQCSIPAQNQICFQAGDARANQHPPLTSLHTVFLREHNRIARQLGKLNRRWNDETIFQETRRIVGAEMQVITYKEYLPITIGPERMSYFRLWLSSRRTSVYNQNLNPTMYHEFSTAAFRFGHSLINSVMARNWRSTRQSPGGQLLRDSFFEPFPLYDGEIEPLLGRTTDSSAQWFDRHVIPDVTNFLYRVRGNETGLDLASFNIQRGRDHGIPPYTEMVQFCSDNQIRVRTFQDLVSQRLMSQENADLLSRNYRHVADIDLWTGILSEFYNDDSVVGPTAICIIGLQFRNLKFGDRFYFEHGSQAGSFTPGQLEELRKVTLTKILCANTGINSLPANAMLLPNRNNQLLSCDRLKDLDLTQWAA